MDIESSTAFSLQTVLLVLNKTNITKSLPPKTFSYMEKCTCANLDEAICNLPDQQQNVLVEAAQCKRHKLSSRPVLDPITSGCADNPFLETVSSECCHNRLIKFIDTMGMDTITTLVCAVCAGCFFKKETTLVTTLDLKAKKGRYSNSLNTTSCTCPH